MNEPQPSFPPPNTPGQPRRGLPVWVIVVIATLGGSVVLCAIAGFVIIGVLNSLGSRVDSVFEEINSELETGTTYDPDATIVPASTPVPVDVSQAQPIGDTIGTEGFSFVVRSTKIIESIEGAPEPQAGFTYMSVTLEATNTGSYTNVLSAFSSQLQDGETIYSLSLFGQTASDSDNNLIDPIDPGESKTETYIYEVPQETDELFWVYQPATGEPVVVTLQ